MASSEKKGWNIFSRAEKVEADPMQESGATGLDINYGLIKDEFLRELQGTNGTRVFRQMSDNDPVIGAFLFVWEYIMRQVTWSVEPASVDNEAAADDVADFIRGCMSDMEHSWNDVITEAITMIVYGYSLLEEVYKVRGGPTGEKSTDSKYNDRRIGWRKMSPRSQESIRRWNYSEDGDLESVTQALPGGSDVVIAYSKLIHFRTTSRRGNPQGRSMLRNAYRPWYRKTRIEDVEAIGAERDLAGYPVIDVPMGWLTSAASPTEKATVSILKDIVVNIRRDRLEGAIMPTKYDESGNKLIDFRLVNGGGSRQFNTTEIITRYNTEILMSVLADFLMMGHAKVGTQSLAVEKVAVFKQAVETVCDEVGAQLDKAILRLVKANGIDPALSPTLSYSEILPMGMGELVEAIARLSNTGADLGSDEIINNVLRRLSLPELPSKDEI